MVAAKVSCPLLCVLLLAVAGCRHGEPPSAALPPLAEFPVAWAGADCAPWDGNAITIYFGAEGMNPDFETPPVLRVSLWKNLDTLAGRTWRWPPEEQVGAASWCPTESDCEAATAAVITLDAIQPDSALAGTLHLEFPKRPPVTGRFRAGWRVRRVLCG